MKVHKKFMKRATSSQIYELCSRSGNTDPRANGAKRRSGRKPVARATNSALREVQTSKSQQYDGLSCRKVLIGLRDYFVLFRTRYSINGHFKTCICTGCTGSTHRQERGQECAQK